MRPLLRNLHVDELIVHDIPKKLAKKILRGSDELVDQEPIFSEIASPIDTDTHNFFHDKISESIGSNDAVDIIFNTEVDNPIKPLIIEYFTSDSNRRISITKIIARYLFDIQNAINSSGLLLFARGLIGERVMLAILKVEREEGIRVRQKEVESGLITFDIVHIHDLMLTKKTKLFKIVLFYEEENIIKGILCDKQRSNSEKNVADFFISDFLGCILTEEPQILTKKFFDETQKFINEKITSPEQKGELINHLISELTDNNTIVSPTGFARRVLAPNKCDEYIEYLRNNGMTTVSFTKENNLIENRLKKIQYNFSSGIFVLGTKEALTTKSRVTEMENGEMKIEITDSLEQVKIK